LAAVCPLRARLLVIARSPARPSPIEICTNPAGIAVAIAIGGGIENDIA